MRTEQQVLKLSLVGILAISGLGIGFGLFSGSFAILFDGVFSLIDAVMSVVSITLAGLIAKSAADELPRRTRNRFSMGFWHFEPIVLAINALLLISVTTYALVQAIASLLSGGRDVEFGPAVVYASVVLVLTTTIAIVEHRANRTLQSSLVEIDVKGWAMGGGVTAALLIAFVVGLVIDGTDAEWLMPYVDPAVLAVVALVLLPLPFGTLRRAVSEIALITPTELREQAEDAARAVVAEHGFTGYRVYAAQQGRARTIDIVFSVPPAEGLRPLDEWDAIRDGLRAHLDGDDPHSWIGITFTTRTLRHMDDGTAPR